MSMKSKNHNHGGGIPKRKPDMKRRLMKKLGGFMLFLMVMFFVLSLVFIGSGLLVQGTVAARDQRFMLAGASCVAALLSLLGFFIVLGIRRLYANRKDSSRRSFSNAGSSMLLVLILTATAAGILLQLQTSAAIRRRAADSAMIMTRLKIAAGDTAQFLLRRLADDDDLLSDHLGEDWAAPIVIEYPDGIRVSARVLDSQRRFDLNNLAATRPQNSSAWARQLLRDMMSDCAIPAISARLDALADWIDADSDGLYESSLYGQREAPYNAPDSFLQGLDELKWIQGWDAGTYRSRSSDDRPALAHLTTVIPSARNTPVPVNINTAPAEVLASLLGGRRQQLVDMLLSLRENTPFKSLALLENAIDENEIEQLRPFLDVKSSYYDLVVEAGTRGRGVSLNALAQRTPDGSVSILRWSI
jgi:general secretion pathway protein K